MADEQLNSIVNVEKTSKQINDLVAGLDVIIARMEKIIELSAKTGVDIKGATKLKELTDNTEKHNAVEKEAIRLAQQKEKLEVQIISLQTEEAKKVAELNEQKKLINEKARLEAQTNAQLVGAYKALNAQHEINKRALKDMAAAGDTTSASYKKLAKEVQETDIRLKKIDETTGEHRRKVGHYQLALENLKQSFSKNITVIDEYGQSTTRAQTATERMQKAGAGLSVVWMGLMGVMAGLAGAFKVARDAIASTDALTDKWEETVSAAKEGYSAFLRTLATGDWSNFITNIRLAISAGAQYARMLDEIHERTLGLSIAEAEAKMRINDLILISKDQTKSDKERAAAAKEALKLETDLLQKKSELAWTAFKNELNIAATQTGLRAASVAQYLKLRDENNELIKQSEDYLIALSRLDDEKEKISKSGGADTVAIENATKFQKIIDNTSISIRVYAKEVVEKMGKITPEAMDKVAQAYSDIFNTQNDFKEGTRRLWSTYTGFIKSMQDEKTKANDKEAKSIDKLVKGSIQYIEQLKIIAALNGIDLLHDEVGISKMPSLLSNVTGKPPAKMTKIGIGTVNNTDEPMSEAELLTAKMRKDWIERLEITRDFVGQIQNLISTIYSNQILEIDEAAAADEKEKQRELAAAEGNKKKQDEINEKYRQKEAQRERERKKALHDEAVYNKIIAATQVVINTAVNAMKQSSVALSIAYIALGAIELAAVLAQNIPSYFKGRKGGPAELAKVHPGELIVSNGVATMTPNKESLAYLPAGADVIPASQVKEMAGRFATNSIGRTKSEVTVNVNDRYGKEMLDEMRKKKSEPKIIELKDRVIYQEGNYRQVSMR